ncbi:MAG: 50S ribosomal protein L18 [Candidatus Uhrbacteria bacterium GW2011_GWC2_53_7]|uniref:Large ribosomal subunit protein uL18 n=1 Tax=Candidatus Uhrbacteria bacterium GW2011_GWC2_53_7 TaxID=1618986 RepID=A0A0G2AW58_9BACT|nr:MAG: 50S ribosomal protein L18 [Candidatus Uhrbacteria bacterium GW2011_GWC2_53_7]
MIKNKQLIRARRAKRTRIRIHGTAQRPRLSVRRSLRHIFAQVINDDLGVTLCAASDRTLKDKKGKTERAQIVGKDMAQRTLALGVTEVIFDRGFHRYHGRVRALAEAAREAGLKF